MKRAEAMLALMFFALLSISAVKGQDKPTISHAVHIQQDTTVFVTVDTFASGTMSSNFCESMQSFQPAFMSGEVGAYYASTPDWNYIERGFLGFPTANVIPDTDVVIDSLWMEYYTTSVSGPGTQVYFVTTDSLLPPGYVPSYDPMLWTMFDSLAWPYPVQGLEEHAGPYRQPLDPDIFNHHGYTVVGVRVAMDYQSCGQQGDAGYVYVDASQCKPPRLGIK